MKNLTETTTRKEYQAVAFVHIGKYVIDYISGWWGSKKKACEELNAIMEDQLPAGCYSINSTMRVRRVTI